MTLYALKTHYQLDYGTVATYSVSTSYEQGLLYNLYNMKLNDFCLMLVTMYIIIISIA